MSKSVAKAGKPVPPTFLATAFRDAIERTLKARNVELIHDAQAVFISANQMNVGFSCRYRGIDVVWKSTATSQANADDIVHWVREALDKAVEAAAAEKQP